MDSEQCPILPRFVMRVIDGLLPRVPKLDDFNTDELAPYGRNRGKKVWRVPAPRPEPLPPIRIKHTLRYHRT